MMNDLGNIGLNRGRKLFSFFFNHSDEMAIRLSVCNSRPSSAVFAKNTASLLKLLNFTEGL